MRPCAGSAATALLLAALMIALLGLLLGSFWYFKPDTASSRATDAELVAMERRLGLDAGARAAAARGADGGSADVPAAPTGAVGGPALVPDKQGRSPTGSAPAQLAPGSAPGRAAAPAVAAAAARGGDQASSAEAEAAAAQRRAQRAAPSLSLEPAEPLAPDLGGDYQVTAQLVNESGLAVSEVEVALSLHRLFGEAQGLAPPSGQRLGSSLSDAGGYVQFSGLPDGEYQLTTLPSFLYPQPVSKLARAGSEAIKLMLVEEHEILLRGRVSDAPGVPLAGAAIALSGSPTALAVSDPQGEFSFPLQVAGNRGFVVSAALEGYRAASHSLSSQDWHGLTEVELDFVLLPEKILASVSGQLLNADSAPVGGEQLYLQSGSTKHRARSDAAGYYAFAEVEGGRSYSLWIVPKGPYEQYREELTVPEGGLVGLDILLEGLDFGQIEGVMLDTDGNPVPHFTLLARSDIASGASRQVKGDQDGRFSIVDFPLGRLRIQSDSFPRLVTSGLVLASGEPLLAEVVLDLGTRRIDGRVLDPDGRPVAAAGLTLSWVLRASTGAVHESLRTTSTDADGHFEFSALGAGEYSLITTAPGLQSHTQSLASASGYAGPGGEVEVRLQWAEE